MAEGDLIAGNAMTEDEAGSDVGAAAHDGGATGEEYCSTGRSRSSATLPIADVFVTYAVTDPDAGFLGDPRVRRAPESAGHRRRVRRSPRWA